MNIPLSIVIFIEVFSISFQIDAVKAWKWGWKPKRKRWNLHNSELDHDCSHGQCVEAWRCADHFTGSCAEWNNEPMVCCVLSNDESSYGWDESNIYSTIAANDYFEPSVWMQKSTTTKNYITDSYLNTHYLDAEKKPSVVKPTPISSLGDNFSKSYTIYKIYKDVTTWQHGLSKRTYLPLSTTVSSHKPTAVYPTKNHWISKSTKYPILTTKVLKKVPEKSTRFTSTLVPWGYTTNMPPYSYKSTIASASHDSNKRENESWGKSTLSRPTKSQAVHPASTTKFAVRNVPKSTKKAFVTPLTIKSTKRSHVTSPISKTTKKYGNTIVIPDINNLVCGYRNWRSTLHRQRRDYIDELKPITNDYSAAHDSTSGKHRLPFERIVGGEEAEPFSWPWVVALYKVTSSGGNRFLSAGSLISENYILTAAHVFTPDDLRTASYVVMLGTHNAQDAVAEYLVSSVLQHPRYEHRYYYHDIALLKLNKPVTFTDYIMPVCLPSPGAQLLKDKDLEGKNVTVMGWGDESFGGKSSRVLKEASFPIVSRVFCNNSYIRVASNRFPKGITNDMLCAGDPNGGKDACQGDSGGPLTSIEDGRHTQVGIVSFGYKCGDKEYPGVYTKVAPYVNWIAENIRLDGEHVYY